MFGRAVKEFQPPAKRDQFFTSSPSSSTPKIEEALKKKPSSQSISGYMNPKGNVNVLRSISPNGRMSSKFQKPERALPPVASGLASVLEKNDAFQDVPNTFLHNGSASKQGKQAFESNDWMDDFPDDADIDLDIEEPSALPDMQSFKYKPSSPQKSKTGYAIPRAPATTRPTIPSSAPTWSSSPLSHKLTPPGVKRPMDGHSSLDASTISSEDVADDNPRPAKRRTLPWVIDGSQEQGSSRETVKSRGDFTPLPKDTKSRTLPWNASLSAVKDQQKSFKNQKKLLTRKNEATEDEMATAADSRPLKSNKAQYAPITLNEEQEKILALVVDSGKSVFFTGSAGTGKSVLMRSIIEKLKKKFARDPERVWVTASTGLAACNIGGQTLHSFAGIGLGKEDIPTLVKKIKKNAKSKNRWIKCQTLIIDEISMVDGDLFDKLEGIARSIKNNGRPFGGIQLVVTGDFFQLPPVPDQGKSGIKFAFEARTWNTAIDHTIGLTQVFRQKDPVFANMLNEMRLGKISDETVRIFKSLARSTGEDVTELFPTRNEVDNSNAMRLRQLKGELHRYEANDTGGSMTDQAMKDKLLSNMMAPKVIELKKGAQVMLIKNVDESLVNGSLGHVVGFMSESTFELYDHDPEAFEAGYENEEGLSTKEKNHRKKLKEKISGLKNDSGKLLPLVKFKIADGTSRDMLMQLDDWKVELPNGDVVAQRSQIPLILAWALSIHKAQGQTLERVKVDLGKVFEKGQAYVALSRATCQEGLQVLRFDKNKVMAHPTVVRFYSELYSIDSVVKKTTTTTTTSTSTSTMSTKPKAVSITKKFVKTEVRKPVDEDFDFDEEEEEMRMGGWS